MWAGGKGREKRQEEGSKRRKKMRWSRADECFYFLKQCVGLSRQWLQSTVDLFLFSSFLFKPGLLPLHTSLEDFFPQVMGHLHILNSRKRLPAIILSEWHFGKYIKAVFFFFTFYWELKGYIIMAKKNQISFLQFLADGYFFKNKNESGLLTV